AITHLHHFFGGNQNFAELVFHASQLDALDQRAHDMLLVNRVSMHDVPTLSHGTPLTDNQRNKPTQQAVETPEDQRHDQHHGNHDQSGLRSLLTSRPYDLTDLDARLFCQSKKRLPLRGLQRNETSHHDQSQQRQHTIQKRLSREILIAYDTCDDQSSYDEPLQHIKARVLSFGFGIHERTLSKEMPDPLLPRNLAGQEGIE